MNFSQHMAAFKKTGEIRLDEALDQLLIELATQVLRENEGHVSDTARRLGLNRTTLIHRLTGLGINPRAFGKRKREVPPRLTVEALLEEEGVE